VKRRGPCYDPGEVAQLALAGRVVATQRVVSWLMNHDYDAAEALVAVLSSLGPHGRWIGSVVLRNGEPADEYVVELLDEEWYVKFSVADGRVVIHVWSCCWDGSVH
jgi:hypothetical protein